MSYEDYHTNDFVTDPYFRKWVLSPDEKTQAFWSQWLKLYPAKSTIVKQACLLVQATDVPPANYTNQDYQEVWEKIRTDTASHESGSTYFQPATQFLVKKYRSWIKVAASVAALALLGIYFINQYLPSAQEYKTGYGEILEVSLPDGSTVVLNANSRLIIAADWKSEREVWLSGEAFFMVTKQSTTSHPAADSSGYRKFTVHAGDVAVNVLGTRFNVQKRAERIQVILEEGQVTLQDSRASNDSISLDEGEAITYSTNELSFERKKVDTETRLAWRKGIHQFKAMPLSDVATVLQDTYGFQVHIKDQELEQRRFSAQVPYGKVELLFALLQESLGIEITHQGSVVSMRGKDEI